MCVCVCVGGAGESPVVFSGVSAAVPQRGLSDPGGALWEPGSKVSDVMPGMSDDSAASFSLFYCRGATPTRLNDHILCY